MNATTEQRERAAEIIATMPPNQPRGHAPNWGTQGARDRAYYLAAQLGFNFDPRCTSCEADVYDMLVDAARTT